MLSAREHLLVDTQKVIGDDNGVSAAAPHSTTVQDLLTTLQNPVKCVNVSVCPRPFYSQKLSHVALRNLLPDVKPLRALANPTHNVRDPSWRIAAHAHLWIGGTGSATRARYDIFSNFYVQLIGRKRFLLAYPEVLALVDARLGP